MRSNLLFRGRPFELSTTEDKSNTRKNLDLVLDDDAVVASAREFVAQPVRSFSHSADSKLLVVLQRECAVCGLRVDVVGCDDVTDAVVLFLKLGEAVACTYIDDGEKMLATQDCNLKKLIVAVEECAGPNVAPLAPLQAWITCGFMDAELRTAHVLGLVLAVLNAQPREVDLQLLCTEKLNNVVRNGVQYPVVFGAAYVRAEQRVVPAHFTHLGPAVGLRSVLACFSPISYLLNCYDTAADEISLLGTYEANSGQVDEFLKLPDADLRAILARCPLQEPPRFSATLRALLEFLSNNPDPAKVFGDGPVRFRRSPIGAWVMLPKK